MPAKKKAKRKTAKRTIARTVKGGKGGGRIVSKAFAKENPETTVVETVENAVWRGYAVQLKNGKLLIEGPGDPRPKLFWTERHAQMWADKVKGEAVVSVRVIVG